MKFNFTVLESIEGHMLTNVHMSYFAYACKTEGKNGISRLISELLRTLDSSLRDRLFLLQNEVSELPNHADLLVLCIIMSK